MDTGTEWTLFGQIVILVMIQIGGLGFMTFAILFLRIFRKRFGLKNKEVMVESINTSNLARIVSITNKMLWGTLIFELSGAVLLAIRFVPEYGWGQGLWYGLFHSVSAFCNAGFDLLGVETPFISLVNYADDLLVNGVIMALIVIGGIKNIVKVTEKIVPLKIFIYLFSAMIVIVMNFKQIPHAAWVIVKEAFCPESIYGGMFVAMIMGLRRSVQSNEAGTGSAPIVYATVKTEEPLSQGFVALLDPFLTGFMCTLTAFAIVITGVYKTHAGHTSGIEMTSDAISSVMPFFPTLLAGIVLLYALSTIISWAYYGQKSWNFLFGEGKKRTLTFQFIYCGFIIIGSVLNVTSVINITDAMMIAMSVPNIIAMYILAPEVKKDLKDYCIKHQLGKFINRDWLTPAPAAVTTAEEEDICPTSK